MAHHGPNPFEGFDDKPEFQKRRELMRELLTSTVNFRGALGEFPQGQLAKDDEGSIQFAIGEKEGKVVIDFGTPVHWLGMTPQQAADFASAILKRARQAARKNGETVGFTI
jgi:hypothetical protein